MSIVKEVVVNAPPVTVGSWFLLGHSLPEWAGALTLVYTGVLFFRLTIKWYRGWRRTGDFFYVGD